MPVTGVFLSDFTDFLRGTKLADAELDKLEGHSKAFGTAWESALKKTDFERLLNQPLSTGTELARNFAGGLGTVGKVAVGTAAGVAAVGSAMAALALSTAETAAHLGDMADKTGISVPSLSRLSTAAEVAGSNIDAVSNIVYAMNKRMAEDPRAFEEGLKRIGLTFQQFKTLAPDQQIAAIGEGLKAQVDPLARVLAGNELLGRSYQEMGPAVMDLASAMEKTKGIQPFTAEDAARAKALQQEWALLKLEIRGAGEEIGLIVIPAFTALIAKVREAVAPLKDFWASSKNEAENLKMILDGLATGGITVLAPEVNKLAERQAAWNTQIEATEAHVPTLEEGMAALKELTKENAQHLAESQAEAKKFGDAMEELDSAGKGWKGTLDGIDGEVVSAVKYYLDAGVAQNTLATAYGLTSTQVKAVSESLKEEQAHLKDQMALKEAMFKRELELSGLLRDENRKLADQRKTEIEGAILREKDAHIALNTAMGLTATGAIPGVVSALGTYEAKMKEINDKRVEGWSTTKQEELALYELQQGLIAEARATDQVVASTGKLPAATGAAMTGLGSMSTEAERAARIFDSLKGSIDNAAQVAANMAKTDPLTKLQAGMGGTIPAGAGGGGGAFGPTTRLYGAGGYLGMGTPAGFTGQPLYGGAGGFIGSGVNITINGSVLGNKDEIARVVGNAVTSTYRKSNLLPV